MWSVGVGWYIYIYMTGSETNTFANYSTGFVSSLICGALLGVVGAAVCGIIAVGLIDYITSQTYTSWKCYEFRFDYAGNARGVQEVSSSLC